MALCPRLTAPSSGKDYKVPRIEAVVPAGEFLPGAGECQSNQSEFRFARKSASRWLNITSSPFCIGSHSGSDRCSDYRASGTEIGFKR